MDRLYKLERIRRERKLSRRELSLLSSVGEQTIVALERGITSVDNVKLSTLISLAKALHCQVVDLLDNDLKRIVG